jgi:hypothetical protein
MSELEVEGGEVFFGDIYHGVPIVKPILRKDLEIFAQTQTLKHLTQLRYGWTARRSDRHYVGDVCVRRDGNGRIRLFEACTLNGSMAIPAGGSLQELVAEQHLAWVMWWSDAQSRLIKVDVVETVTGRTGPPKALEALTRTSRQQTPGACPAIHLLLCWLSRFLRFRGAPSPRLAMRILPMLDEATVSLRSAAATRQCQEAESSMWPSTMQKPNHGPIRALLCTAKQLRAGAAPR